MDFLLGLMVGAAVGAVLTMLIKTLILRPRPRRSLEKPG